MKFGIIELLKSLRLFVAPSGNYAELKAPTAISSSYTLKLPAALPSSSLPLFSDLNGNLVFQALVAADIPSIDAGKINSGVVGINRGGTGATIKPFVDLTSAQSVAGTKTFSDAKALSNPITSNNSTDYATTAFVKAQNYQPNLGFTPIQQGGGTGQLSNKLYLGWSGSAIKATVDTTDLGELITSGNFATRSLAEVGYQKLPGAAAFFIQYGSAIINFDATGFATVTIATAFPNNFFTVVVSNGDYTVSPEKMLSGMVANTSQFTARISPAVATVYRINYTAIGN